MRPSDYEYMPNKAKIISCRATTPVVLALLPLLNSMVETIAFQNCLTPTGMAFAVCPSAQIMRSSYHQDFPLFPAANLLFLILPNEKGRNIPNAQ